MLQNHGRFRKVLCSIISTLGMNMRTNNFKKRIRPQFRENANIIHAFQMRQHFSPLQLRHQGSVVALQRPDRIIRIYTDHQDVSQIPSLCQISSVAYMEDVETAARAFAQNGVRVLGEGRPQRNVAGAAIAFIHPGDFLGALVELEQHKV